MTSRERAEWVLREVRAELWLGRSQAEQLRGAIARAIDEAVAEEPARVAKEAVMLPDAPPILVEDLDQGEMPCP